MNFLLGYMVGSMMASSKNPSCSESRECIPSDILILQIKAMSALKEAERKDREKEQNNG